MYLFNMYALPSRSKLQEEFSRQIHAVHQQWENDMEKSQEQEEKLNVSCTVVFFVTFHASHHFSEYV